MTHAYMLLQRLRREVKKRRGRVEADGCGGYEILAPEGRRWKSAEVWCQPLPLSEAESREEKEGMLRGALEMVAEGTERA